MNLYWRLLLVWLRARRKPRIRLGETIELRLTVLPNDLDLNGHMNNGRYLTIVDLALVEYMTRAGFVSHALRQRWRPMMTGSMIAFRRGLRPFRRYTLRFAIDCWDERWAYVRYAFVHDGRVVASGHGRGGIVGPQGVVGSAEMCRVLGVDPVSPPMPAALAAWIEADRLLRAAHEAPVHRPQQESA